MRVGPHDTAPAAERLDADQLRVVGSRARTIRLVAPAGAGKTGTIVARVLARIAAGVAPERILLLTFDRAAAGGLARRLAAAAAAEGRSPPRVATLNAFGYRFLRERAPGLHGRVLPAAERAAIVAEALVALDRRSPARRRALPPEANPRTLLAVFSLLKNALLDPHALDARAAVEFLLRARPAAALLPERGGPARLAAALEAVVWLYAATEEETRARGGLDFDDQKLRAHAALAASPALRAEVANGLEEVVVDEFQDVNALDVALVRTLAARATLVVAGDDDQAIYGFRGCSPEFVVNLAAALGRPVESHELRTNYRNPPNILAAADRLIRRNPNRIAKQPVAHRTDPAAIEVRTHASVDEEAAGIARWVRDRLDREADLGPSDVAILVRTHLQGVPLREALDAAGVPCVAEEPDDLLDDAPRPRAARAGPAVEIKTYFKAKGLQWPTVILPGCNEGVIPHDRAVVEEERRLFYVGLTRASKRLVAAWRAGDDAPPPSRFLAEAGLAG